MSDIKAWTIRNYDAMDTMSANLCKRDLLNQLEDDQSMVKALKGDQEYVDMFQKSANELFEVLDLLGTWNDET